MEYSRSPPRQSPLALRLLLAVILAAALAGGVSYALRTLNL